MSKLISAVPTFLVADVGETISWYETGLGFTSAPFPKSLLMSLPVFVATELK